jgi:hypothetical protein
MVFGKKGRSAMREMKGLIFSAGKGVFQPSERRSQHGGYPTMGIDIKDWNNVENKLLG